MNRFLAISICLTFVSNLAIGQEAAPAAPTGGGFSQPDMVAVPGHPGSFSVAPSAPAAIGEPGQFAGPPAHGPTFTPDVGGGFGSATGSLPTLPRANSNVGQPNSSTMSPKSFSLPPIESSRPIKLPEPSYSTESADAAIAHGQLGLALLGYAISQWYIHTYFPTIESYRPKMRDHIKGGAEFANSGLRRRGNKGQFKIPSMEDYRSALNYVHQQGLPEKFGPYEIGGNPVYFQVQPYDVMKRYIEEETKFLNEQYDSRIQITSEMSARTHIQVEALNKIVEEIQEIQLPDRPFLEIQEPQQRYSEKFQARVDGIQQKLENVYPVTNQERVLKTFAEQSIEAAKNEELQNNHFDSDWYLNKAEMLANFLVGIDPITGTIRAAYESATGRNMITGEELTSFERAMALFALGTLGSSSDIERGLQLVEKIGIAAKPSQRLIENLAQKIHMGESLLPSLGKFYERTVGKLSPQKEEALFADIEKALFKTDKNERLLEVQDWETMTWNYLKEYPDHKIPYQFGSYGLKIETITQKRFLRLSVESTQSGRGSQPIGRFLLKEADAIAPNGQRLNSLQFQNKYSTPEPPNFITNVEVKANTTMLKTRVGENFGGSEGAFQYELLERIPRENFQNTRPIGDWLNGK